MLKTFRPPVAPIDEPILGLEGNDPVRMAPYFHGGASHLIFHQTRRGVLAHFAADQCIGRSLGKYGEWAEEEIALLRNYLSKGDAALDVGANVGAHTLAFAQMVGKSGKVIAIEGQPEVATLLSYNVVANDLSDRVHIVQALAGSRPALVPYVASPPGANMGAKTFVPNVRNPESVTINGMRTLLPLLTLDSLSLTSCSLIKIDVEGMEEDVLTGAMETLRSFRPAVYFEYANNDTSALARMHGLLRAMGYRLFWHVSNPFNRLNFKGETLNIFGGAMETNVLAVCEQTAPPLPEIIDPTISPPRHSPDESVLGAAIP